MVVRITNFSLKKMFNALKLCVGLAMYKKNTNSATKFNTFVEKGYIIKNKCFFNYKFQIKVHM